MQAIIIFPTMIMLVFNKSNLFFFASFSLNSLLFRNFPFNQYYLSLLSFLIHLHLSFHSFLSLPFYNQPFYFPSLSSFPGNTSSLSFFSFSFTSIYLSIYSQPIPSSLTFFFVFLFNKQFLPIFTFLVIPIHLSLHFQLFFSSATHLFPFFCVFLFNKQFLPIFPFLIHFHSSSVPFQSLPFITIPSISLLRLPFQQTFPHYFSLLIHSNSSFHPLPVLPFISGPSPNPALHAGSTSERSTGRGAHPRPTL